ncbi:MAG: hypothetical protein WA117_14875 [Verrucomicrobiia bacterium]
MDSPIASVDLVKVTKDGSRRDVYIEIGQPFPDRGAWACPAFLRGINRKPKNICGADSLQALCLALHFVRTQLEKFLRRGGRILMGTEDFPLNAYFDVKALYEEWRIIAKEREKKSAAQTGASMNKEIRATCKILESLAKSCPRGSAKQKAIREAAYAFIYLRMHEGLNESYRAFRRSCTKPLTKAQKQTLKKAGVKP